MSSFGNVTVKVTHNLGVISLGDGNTIDLQALALPPDQQARVQAAVKALADSGVKSPDAVELKAAVAAAPSAAARTERVAKWLLKLAPAAAGVAGSLLNPALGKVAEQLAGWVARQFDPPA